MRKTVYIENDSVNPAYNLALEQYVFDELPRDCEYFWLWQNDRTIVVGKHQNTVQEINASYVKEHGIRVVRRLSGGGAVYHDLGNVNFTFIADAGELADLNLSRFCLPVVRTLEKIGICASVSGRNDIVIDGRKFSGNSQYIRDGRIMHHGTLMFDSDLSVVDEALHVSDDKYESKGFRSVRSRVTNIRPYAPEGITMEIFQKLLRDNMLSGAPVRLRRLDETEKAGVERLQRVRYDTWEWNYGASPRYSVRRRRRIEGCGMLEISMAIEAGKITAYESFGDYFGNGATEELQARLKGCPLEENALKRRLENFDLEACYSRLALEVFINMLLQ